MVHIFASLAFSLIAVGALGLTAIMLLQDQDRIMTALGFRTEPAQRTARHRVRVRAAGRWHAASATAARPWRAAA